MTGTGKIVLKSGILLVDRSTGKLLRFDDHFFLSFQRKPGTQQTGPSINYPTTTTTTDCSQLVYVASSSSERLSVYVCGGMVAVASVRFLFERIQSLLELCIQRTQSLRELCFAILVFPLRCAR